MKNRIRIARGNVSTSTETADVGVPFYDTVNKRLYIGKDNTTQIKNYTSADSPIAFEATNADNVSKTINGVNITDIFASDGYTAKYSNVSDFTLSVFDHESRNTYEVRIVSSLPNSPDAHTIYMVVD